MTSLAYILMGCFCSLGSVQIDHPIVGKWKTTEDFKGSEFWDEIGSEMELFLNGRFWILSDGGMDIQTVREGKFELKEEKLLLDYFGSGELVEFAYRFEEGNDELFLKNEDWEFRLVRTDEPHNKLRALPRMPESLDEAASLLISEMTEEDRAYVATRMKEDLISFHMGWGMGIRNRFGLWSGNDKLLESCGYSRMHPDAASSVIIEEVWRRLRETWEKDYLAEIEKVHAVCRDVELPGAGPDDASLEEVETWINQAILKAYPEAQETGNPINEGRGKRGIATVDQISMRNRLRSRRSLPDLWMQGRVARGIRRRQRHARPSANTGHAKGAGGRRALQRR